jgi:hypothetical protein
MNYKRIIILLLITIMLQIYFMNPVAFYIYTKISNRDVHCMENYIHNYYPHGCYYILGTKLPHVDKCGLTADLIHLQWEIRWCIFVWSIKQTIINGPYCMWTYVWEYVFK